MITEDFCSFEVAKLLKEKGFDELCIFKYNSEGVRMKAGVAIDEWQNSELDDDECSCVSLQMTMKWLRKKHNIMVEIYLPHEYEHEEEIWDGKYCFELFSLTNGHSIFWDETEYSTYEDAVEAACIYSLENLIKKEYNYESKNKKYR